MTSFHHSFLTLATLLLSCMVRSSLILLTIDISRPCPAPSVFFLLDYLKKAILQLLFPSFYTHHSATIFTSFLTSDCCDRFLFLYLILSSTFHQFYGSKSKIFLKISHLYMASYFSFPITHASEPYVVVGLFSLTI